MVATGAAELRCRPVAIWLEGLDGIAGTAAQVAARAAADAAPRACGRSHCSTSDRIDRRMSGPSAGCSPRKVSALASWRSRAHRRSGSPHTPAWWRSRRMTCLDQSASCTASHPARMHAAGVERSEVSCRGISVLASGVPPKKAPAGSPRFRAVIPSRKTPMNWVGPLARYLGLAATEIPRTIASPEPSYAHGVRVQIAIYGWCGFWVRLFSGHLSEFSRWP
jgi:hypothetical protein